MGCPDPFVLGDQPPFVADAHCCQVGGNVDAAADGGRVHRTVVAVPTHVMVTRQPQT